MQKVKFKLNTIPSTVAVDKKVVVKTEKVESIKPIEKTEINKVKRRTPDPLNNSSARVWPWYMRRMFFSTAG